VRVISGIADVDFSVHSVSREGPHLVVRDRKDAALPTVVYLTPRDVVDAMKALLSNTAALGFVLSAPWKTRHAPVEQPGGIHARDDVNNPWK
jgi:hypothetical protein